jgi:hypothetical protein
MLKFISLFSSVALFTKAINSINLPVVVVVASVVVVVVGSVVVVVAAMVIVNICLS